MNRLARRVAKIGGLLASQLVLMVVGIHLLYGLFEIRQTVNVRKEAVPDLFPVVVVTPSGASGGHDARVLWQRDLAAFLATHPDHSFAIPENEAASLRALVEGATRAHGVATSQFWFATFKVWTGKDGSQQMEVEGTGNDNYRNRSWYEVRDGSITAMQHLHYFGPGVGMVFGIPVLAAVTLLNLALWYGARRLYLARSLRAAQHAN